MGAQLRVYRRRIRSVQSTRKITKAMELISASRIARAQARMHAARPYAEELTRALGAVLQDESLKHPMLNGVENPRRAGILLITSDRGQAGGYNANAIRTANELAAQLESEGKQVVRYVIGRKGVAYYRFRRIELAARWTGFSDQPTFADVRELTEQLLAELAATSANPTGYAGSTDPGLDELYVVRTRFVNSVTQVPVADQLAPIKSAVEAIQREAAQAGAAAPPEGREAGQAGQEQRGQGGKLVSYDFEPEPEQLLGALLPRYISSRIYSALLESAASEWASRRRAMKSASDNANELIRVYTRLANEARQAEITQEISEIVGGADALAASGNDE